MKLFDKGEGILKDHKGPVSLVVFRSVEFLEFPGSVIIQSALCHRGTRLAAPSHGLRPGTSTGSLIVAGAGPSAGTL